MRQIESKESERKSLIDAIGDLLRTAEEMKAHISPLAREQKDIFTILGSHYKSITRLMDILVGTQKAQKERLKRLEHGLASTETHVSELEERLESHEKTIKTLKEQMSGSEFKPIRRVIDKLGKGQVSEKDLRVIEKSLSLHPNKEHLWKVKSNILYQLVRYRKAMKFEDEALRFIDEAISKFPDSYWPWYMRGLILRDDFKESLKSFDKSHALLKSDDSLGKHLVFFSRAALLHHNKKLKEALESAIKSVEAMPDCANGWIVKGQILFRLSRSNEALGCFEKALELDNKKAKAWFGKGRALAALGPDASNQAISCYDKVIELKPTHIGARLGKVNLLVEKTDYKDALDTVNKALELDDKNSCAWCKKSAVLDMMGQAKKALESYRKAIELGPPKECGIIFNNYAYLLVQRKECEEGLRIAKRAVELEPEKAEYLDTLACCLEALGKDQEALEVFAKAVKLAKKDKQITWDVLARVYDKLGRTKEAAQARQKAEDLKSLGNQPRGWVLRNDQ